MSTIHSWVDRWEATRWQSTSLALHSLAAGRRAARSSATPASVSWSFRRQSSSATPKASARAAGVAGGSSMGRVERVITVVALSAPR